MFPSNLHHSAPLSERKQVLGQLNLVISKLFLQQVFKHPGKPSFIKRKYNALGSPVGINKLKTYFLVYKVLILLTGIILLIDFCCVGWMFCIPASLIAICLFVITPPSPTQSQGDQVAALPRVIHIILLTENKYSILSGSKPQPRAQVWQRDEADN